jgi:small subunit ribosomal protein S1
MAPTKDTTSMTTLTYEAIVAEKPADTEGWIQVEGGWIPDYEANLRDVTEGEVVVGIVVRIDNDEVLVDIGYKSEGVIPSNELSIRRNVNPRDEVELGEEVDALVLTKEDPDGRLILSKKRARFEKAWRRIEAAAEAGELVTGRVIEVVKGGLILDLGVRGFLPASLVDIRRVQDLLSFLDTDIDCKVIELNRSRNNVVLSRRAVLEEERREVRQRILDHLNVGDVVEGTISNIVEFGAFVDLDGIDGLIHISELSWSHVNHPNEVIEIGQTVQVKVLDIDRDRQRISLGLKQTREDPWQKVLNDHQVGDEIEGVVTKAVTFGAFVELFPGVEGLVHISELSWEHVENPREVVNPGDKVSVKLIEIDPERRRISLSIKQTTERPADRRRLRADRCLRGGPGSGRSVHVDGRRASRSSDTCPRRGRVLERRADRCRRRAGRGACCRDRRCRRTRCRGCCRRACYRGACRRGACRRGGARRGRRPGSRRRRQGLSRVEAS